MMTPDEHQRISAAIRTAEKHTAGEIYCVVARSSASYFFEAAFSVTAAMLLISLALAWVLHQGWYQIDTFIFVAAQILSTVCATLVIWAFPALRIWLVPRRVAYRRGHDNAMKQFLSRNVHLTTARTGVLLFVSLAEQYAEVVADAGINARVPQADWDRIVGRLVVHARDRNLAKGFVEAVDSVGALLAAHFPPTAGDRNELDDHLVEI